MDKVEIKCVLNLEFYRNGSMMNTNVIFYLQPTFRTFLDSDLSLIRYGCLVKNVQYKNENNR